MRIALINMGGTITRAGPTPIDVIEYVDAGSTVEGEVIAADLRRLVPEHEIDAWPGRGAVSSALGPSDWLALLTQLRARVDEYDAFIVLHGTSTIEETAYFVSLTWPHAVPVIFVGAQRPYTTVSSDAQLNLVNAVRYAAAPESRELGVVLVMNDEIHAARDVRKVANRRLNAFESPGFGPLGVVDGDRVNVVRRPMKNAPPRFGLLADPVVWPRVDILYSYAGGDGALVDAAVAAGARGLVCAGFAPGLVSPAQEAALVRARAQGIAVVQASRAVRDRVTHRRIFAELGFVASGDLSPQKARILLLLCLSTGIESVDALTEIFDSQ